MKTKKESEQDYFHGVYEVLTKHCLAKVFHYMDSLHLNELSASEKEKVIHLETALTMDQTIALNRSQYILYAHDKYKLFNLLESTGNLHNEEEYQLLSQAMELREKLDNLNLITIDLDVKRQVAGIFATNGLVGDRQPALELPGLMRREAYLQGGALSVNGRMDCTLSPVQQIKEKVLNLIMLKVNQRLHMFVRASSIERFVRFILNPREVPEQPPIYIDCLSKEFKYILHRLKAFNPDLTYACVGNSGLFYSRTGTLFNEHCLDSTNYEGLHTRLAIDNIFDEYLYYMC